MDRGGGDVGYEADEVESPHGGIAPCVEYVAEFGRFFEGCKTLGWVIAEDALCHLAQRSADHMERVLTLVMMTSWRSVYQGFRHNAPVVRVGETGRYR